MLLKARLKKIELNQRLLVFFEQSAYLFPSYMRRAKAVYGCLGGGRHAGFDDYNGFINSKKCHGGTGSPLLPAPAYDKAYWKHIFDYAINAWTLVKTNLSHWENYSRRQTEISHHVHWSSSRSRRVCGYLTPTSSMRVLYLLSYPIKPSHHRASFCRVFIKIQQVQALPMNHCYYSYNL